MGFVMTAPARQILCRIRRRAEDASESLNLRGVLHVLEAIKADVDEMDALTGHEKPYLDEAQEADDAR
jgi:hypothetical protein